MRLKFEFKRRKAFMIIQKNKFLIVKKIQHIFDLCCRTFRRILKVMQKELMRSFRPFAVCNLKNGIKVLNDFQKFFFIGNLIFQNLIELKEFLLIPDHESETFLTVAASSPNFLIIIFQTGRSRKMDDKTDVFFVNSHPESISRNQHFVFTGSPALLFLMFFPGRQTCMEKIYPAFITVLSKLGKLLSLSSGFGINDA